MYIIIIKVEPAHPSGRSDQLSSCPPTIQGARNIFTDNDIYCSKEEYRSLTFG